MGWNHVSLSDCLIGSLSNTPAMTESASNPSFRQRHYHLLRRLHSLTGVIPIGVFVFFHLFTNGSMAFGAETFEHEIDFIYSLPGLLMLEIFGIWLPIAFHAVLGVLYVFTAEPNNTTYRYGANWRYTLMRISGIVALIFIFVHLSTTRWGWSYWGYLDTPFDVEHPAESTAAAVQVYWWMPWFYLLGVVASVYHLANGLWTAAITWGLTISRTAQQRWAYICFAVGAVIMVMGLAATWSFATYELPATEPSAAVVNDGPIELVSEQP